MKIFIRLWIIIGIVWPALACGPGPKRERIYLPAPVVKESGGGSMDGGGGNPTRPTADEALKESKRMWALLSGSRPDNPFFIAFFHLRREAKKQDSKRSNPKILAMVAKILGANLSDETALDEYKLNLLGDNPTVRLPEAEISTYLKHKKPDYKMDAYCNGPGHSMTTASVTKLNRDGEVCVSIFALTKELSASLRTDLLGLLAHEIAHLNGYNETDAKDLQKYFIDESFLALRKQSAFTKARFAAHTIQMLDKWKDLIQYEPIDKNYMDKIIKIEREFEDVLFLSGIPYWGDDLEIAQPERYEEIQLHFTIFAEFEGKVAKLTGGQESFPIQTNILTLFRELAFDCIKAQKAVLDYLYGPGADIPDEIPNKMGIEKNRLKAMQVTDPSVLTLDPKPNPKIILFDTIGLFSK